MAAGPRRLGGLRFGRLRQDNLVRASIPGWRAEAIWKRDSRHAFTIPRVGYFRNVGRRRYGKPIVIGETFPLSCGADDEREFLLRSRAFAKDWIGHWPDESPEELAQLKKQGKVTIAQSMWLSWVDLFRELGPEMKKQEGHN